MADLGLAGRLFDALAAIGADAPGITRQAYGPGENEAHRLVRETAAALGLETRADAAGNLMATLPGRDRSHCLAIGSHLDSVRHGGNYDGAAGVVCGLLVAADFAAAGERPPLDLAVMALRAEESVWFPESYIGSKSALGRLPAEALQRLKRSDSGRSLAWHMADAGFDPAGVARGEPLIAPSRIAAFVEPHIEQGPLLQHEGWPVAAVTAVAGSVRFRRALCRGRQGHSGAVPHRFRADAVLGAAALVLALDGLRRRLEEAGEVLTLTVGELFTDPHHHAFSKIAGECVLSIDARSPSPALLERLPGLIAAEAEAVSQGHGVAVELGELTSSSPVELDTGLCDTLRGLLAERLPSAAAVSSGAGHDAALFQAAGVPAAMLFIRNENGSHNPEESMRLEDLGLAAEVLADLVRRWPASRPR